MTRFCVWMALAVCGCPRSSATSGGADAAPSTTASDAPTPTVTHAAPVTLSILYGSEKKTWLEEQAQAFQKANPVTPSGHPIRVKLEAMGSGEAMTSILDGSKKPTVFSPASSVYLTLLNDAWLTAVHPKAIVPKAGEPLVLSPVVIAMWRPMAEKLGWPSKSLSWADLLKVASNPQGWGALGAPEWGRFKLGHTNPDYSNSGFLSVLAETYAGAKKTRDLTEADLAAKPTRDFLAQVEASIVHYGKSTGFFADKMTSRGPKYLSAAVLYENLVIESYAKPPGMPPLVAIYPVEGTFWSDHPWAVLDAAWVGPDEKQAADAFFTFLRARPAQERALALGFRPADASIAIGAPVDAAHGVDPKQPQTILPVPEGKILAELGGLWRATKKPSDVVFTFDKSGSMDGKPLEEARMGAKSFVSSLGARDQVTLMFFDAVLYPPAGPFVLGTHRQDVDGKLDLVVAGGGTALYDAVAKAYDLAQGRATANPNQIHAVLVMTDGQDENSTMTLDQLLAKFPKEDPVVKVFTIAYGQDAEGTILQRIAEAGGGSFSKGSVSDIRSVYLDMAAFF